MWKADNSLADSRDNDINTGSLRDEKTGEYDANERGKSGGGA